MESARDEFYNNAVSVSIGVHFIVLFTSITRPSGTCLQ
jgi:hypothetical protein